MVRKIPDFSILKRIMIKISFKRTLVIYTCQHLDFEKRSLTFAQFFKDTVLLRKTIVYIIGAGRSGTSLLDIVLGNGEGISSCGELARYFALWGIPHQYPEESEKALFWRQFKSRFESKFTGEVDYNEMYRLERKFEYHSSFFRNYFGSNPETFKVYLDNLEKVYATAFEMIDDYVIVDSSKYPARALSLTKLKDYNLKFIYLRRHPVSVVNSFAKEEIEQKSKSWLGANAYYFGANFLSTVAIYELKKNFPVYMLRYEDFIESTEDELRLWHGCNN